MGTNSRDLRVRFVGDASSLSSTFQEVRGGAAASAAAMTQTDVSANTVGKSFVRTGKLVKATGKVFKTSGLDALSMGSAFMSTVPQFGAVAGALGTASVAADGLQGAVASLGAFALPALAAALVAGGVAYAVFHNDTSGATDALRRLEAEQQKVKASHRDVALAALNQRNAVRDLEQTQLSARSSVISLEQANRDLIEVEKEHGRASIEYRSALLNQQQAEAAVRDGQRASVDQAQKVIASVERRAKATEAETKAIAKQAREAERAALGLRTGLISGDDRAKASRKVKDALEAEAGALNRSASRHRDNAREARAAADALEGDTTPAVVTLRRKLLELAGTELDMSQVIAAMNNLSGAADTAAAGVQRVYDLLRNPPPTPSVGVRSGGGGGGGGGKGGQSGQSADARRLFVPGGNPLSPTDVADLIIDNLSRDDSLQDKQTRARAETRAKGAGFTNPDEIALRGERAVLRIRKTEITANMGTVRAAVKKVNGLIDRRKKKRAKAYTALAGVKGQSDAAKDKRQKIQDSIASDSRAIRDRYDELNALIRRGADLQAEAAELGFDIQGLDAEIAATPDLAPVDPVAPESSDTGASAAGAVGPSADAQAQIDQANQRAAVAQNESRAFGAFVKTLRGSGGIDPGGGTTVVQHIYGNMVEQAWAGRWVVNALASQGAPSPGAFSSAA